MLKQSLKACQHLTIYFALMRTLTFIADVGTTITVVDYMLKTPGGLRNKEEVKERNMSVLCLKKKNNKKKYIHIYTHTHSAA